MMRRLCLAVAVLGFAAWGAGGPRAARAGDPAERGYISVTASGHYERTESGAGALHWLKVEGFPTLEINPATIVDPARRKRLGSVGLAPGTFVTVSGLLSEAAAKPGAPRRFVCDAKTLDPAPPGPQGVEASVAGRYSGAVDSGGGTAPAAPVVWAAHIPVRLRRAGPPDDPAPTGGARVLVQGALLGGPVADDRGGGTLVCQVKRLDVLDKPDAALWREAVAKARAIDRAGGMAVYFLPGKDRDLKAEIEASGFQIKAYNPSGSLSAVKTMGRETDPGLLASILANRDAIRWGADGVTPLPSGAVHLFPDMPSGGAPGRP